MEKTLTVKRHSYERRIKTRPVTFICKSHPGGASEITEERYPGPMPNYCLTCRDSGRMEEYKAEQALERYHKGKLKALDTV